MEEITKRIRMNVNLTAKGTAQWEVTAEYADPAEAATHLSEAIDKVKAIIKEKGYKEAGEAA